jgi:hypothetical protein
MDLESLQGFGFGQAHKSLEIVITNRLVYARNRPALSEYFSSEIGSYILALMSIIITG